MSTEINIKKKLAILEEGASVTTDATSIDFVGSGVNASTVGNDVTITIPGNSGNTTYYLNESITQAPYKEFSSLPTAAAEQVVPLTVLAGATSVIAEYQTPSGVPGTTQIPAGLWQLFLHFNAGAAGQNWIIRPTVYKRDLGGIETLLFTPDPEIVTGMSTTTTMYVCDGVFPATTLLTTDRIVVRISMQNTTGVSQTVNFRTEGSQHYSVGLTTLNQVVPTGAVTSVTGTAPIASSGGLTPAISIPQSSATVDGYLSSSDWAVFNSKIGGSGTINYLSKWSSTSGVTDSNISDDGAGNTTITATGDLRIFLKVPAGGVANVIAFLKNNINNFIIGVDSSNNYIINSYDSSTGAFVGNALTITANTLNVTLASLAGSGTRMVTVDAAGLLSTQDAITLTTTGTSGASTLVGSTLNIPQYAGGLTYFTEAQSTTAPNATVNVDSLTAIASTTNADFVIKPKGTGAILSSIPDGTLAGGNKRGAYSVDLQLQRNNATHVASGTNCVISGGARNTATSTYSAVVGGYNNTSSNDYTVTGGYNNTASGYASTVFGNQNTGSGTANFVVGSLSTCSGNYDGALGSTNNVQSATRSSFAIGSNNTITSGGFSIALGGYNTLDGYVACAMGESNTGSTYSTMLGRNGWSNGTPKMVYSGYGWVTGDNQKSSLMLNARTTGATPTTLVVYQASNAIPGVLNQLILPNNSCFSVKGRIVGKKSGSIDVGVWDLDFIIVRGTTAATTALVGTPSITVITNIPAWGTPTVTANTTLGCPTVQVTGLATTNIQWTFAPESVEVIYA
jgi:hypothetical protein